MNRSRSLTPVVDWRRLRESISEHRRAYRSASPWPHLVLRDVFPSSLLDDVVAETQSIDRAQMAAAATRTMVKRETAEEMLLGPATRRALDAFSDPEFLHFLEDLTGIPELLSDDERFWAGVHETPPGGFTMVHTDFQVHPTSKLHHRTNALLYLNRDWRPEWGGQLELWPPAMDALGQRIEPLFNTLVLFETTPATFHGLPEPVACPDGRSRLSLAAYQYSSTPADVKARRWAKYAARPGDARRIGLPTWWDVKEHAPGPVRRLARIARRAVGR